MPDAVLIIAEGNVDDSLSSSFRGCPGFTAVFCPQNKAVRARGIGGLFVNEWDTEQHFPIGDLVLQLPGLPTI